MKKTTILYWDRQTGKSTELIQRIVEYEEQDAEIQILVLGVTLRAVDYLKRIHPNRRRKGTIITSWNSQVRGLHPDVIAIDNIEMMPFDKFREIVYPLMPLSKELIVTTSHAHGLHIIAPPLPFDILDDLIRMVKSDLHYYTTNPYCELREGISDVERQKRVRRLQKSLEHLEGLR